MEHKVLYKGLAGSRLYGLNHADSDWDYYVVVDKVKTNKAKYAKHSIVGDQDVTTVDFGTWVGLLQKGVPQALEAAFASAEAVEIDELADFRRNFRAGTDYSAYRGMMYEIAQNHDDFKHKRHLLRLAQNVRSLRMYNRFNPRLTPLQTSVITKIAKDRSMEEVSSQANRLAWSV